jgi:hypothetical protein
LWRELAALTTNLHKGAQTKKTGLRKASNLKVRLEPLLVLSKLFPPSSRTCSGIQRVQVLERKKLFSRRRRAVAGFL